MSRKVINVIKHNIKKHIKNKFFIILNIILFLVCIIGLNFSEITTALDNHFNGKIIEVYDTNGMFYEELTNEFLKENNIKIKRINKVEYDKENFESNRIIIEIDYNDTNVLNIKTISNKLIDEEYYNKIVSISEKIRNNIYSEKNGIDEELFNLILADINIETIITENNEFTEEQENLFMIAILIPYVGFFLIMNTFSKEIFTEKTSKSSEYILTTITAKQYVFIKIGTTIITTIIQILLLILYYLISSIIKSLFIGDSLINVLQLNQNIIKIALIEFMLFIPYIFIMLIIQMMMSAKADDSSDLDSTTKITLILATITMMGSFLLIELLDFETTWIGYNILSWFPMFSTFFIPGIIAYNNIKLIQVISAVLAYIILIAFLIRKLKISEKIKNGILDYKPQKNKESKIDDIKKQDTNIANDIKEKIYKKQVSKYAMLIGIAIILFLVLSSFILPLITEPLLSGMLGKMFNKENLAYVIDIINAIIAMYIPTKIIIIFNGKTKNEKSNNKFKSLIIGIPFTAIVFTIQNLLTKLITGRTMGTESITTDVSYLLIFIRLVVVPAIFEELFFRKAVLNASKKFGTGFAIIISSVLFGLIHLNFYQAIGAMFAGVIFAIITLKTGSIIPSIVLHAFANSYSFFATILWVDNPVCKNLLNIFIIGFSIIGLVVALENFVKNKKQFKEDFILLKNEKNKERNKILFNNYYFIISIILIVVCFTITQKYMGMLM